MEYVLILEDDAELMRLASRDDFARVDTFLDVQRPRAYTLGSVGLCTPHRTHHMQIGWVAGLAYAQAVVWSAALRQRLLATSGATIPQIDGQFLSKFAPLVTYHKPLVTQRFPQTENMNMWHMFTSKWLEPIDAVCIGSWVRLLRALRLDRDTSHWHTLYKVQANLPIFVGLLVVVYTVIRTASTA
jgi:hypothetical protein